jgi:hypothetical protein
MSIPLFEGRLASSIGALFLLRRFAWTGRRYIAPTADVSIMENLLKLDGWFATAAVGANPKPAVRRVEAA